MMMMDDDDDDDEDDNDDDDALTTHNKYSHEYLGSTSSVLSWAGVGLDGTIKNSFNDITATLCRALSSPGTPRVTCATFALPACGTGTGCS